VYSRDLARKRKYDTVCRYIEKYLPEAVRGLKEPFQLHEAVSRLEFELGIHFHERSLDKLSETNRTGAHLLLRVQENPPLYRLNPEIRRKLPRY